METLQREEQQDQRINTDSTATHPVSFTRENKSGLEGEIVTRRKLANYERWLGFEGNLLEGRNVLNFGCGGSNVGEELAERGIQTNVIDLDIRRTSTSVLSVFMKKDIEIAGKLNQKLYKLHNSFKKDEERQFVQGDGRSLPFPDETFDFCLALWSTYQIPDQAKEGVFRELLRVGDILHLGPIFKRDFDVLQKLTLESEHEIVLCQPFFSIKKSLKREKFKANSLSDYQEYIAKNPEGERILEPQEDNSKVLRVLEKSVVAMAKGGSLVVLKRTKEN